MGRRDDFFRVLAGEKPERIPLISFGFWNEKAMRKLAPADCCDENMLPLISDDPPRDAFSQDQRTQNSRECAVRMGAFLDTSSIGVGKGGLLSFGHGGPGEIQPVVIERTSDYKILQYEGGHKRQVNFEPHSVRFFDFPVKTEQDLDHLELPNMRDPARFKDIAEDCRVFRQADFVPAGSIQGFFSGIHNSFMDFQDTLENLLLKPDFITRVTERFARMSLDATEMLLERGVEVINVCDDLGTSENMLISPRVFRRFFLAWYEELTHIVHAKGKFIHLHSHGNIAPIVPDLAAIGIDIVNPFNWNENPSLTELIEKYGDQIVFCGGLEGNMTIDDLNAHERIVKRACGLGKRARRGYMLLGPSVNAAASTEQYRAWQNILANCRRMD